ncbi:MAG TPA: universal stress protein [Mycobacteriales bacterium]
MAGQVLVGVDGSEPSMLALDWAVSEAVGRDAGLTVCCVANDDSLAEPALWTTPQLIKEHAGDVVRRAEARARDAAPQLELTGEVMVGAAAEQLIAASRDADLLVLGCRGLGAFLGLLLGSVSERVAQHSACPVVVVRGSASSWDGPVLLGVDGAPESAAAVEYAFTAADRRQVDIVALTAAPPPWIAPPPSYPIMPVTEEAARTALQGLQEDAIRAGLEQHPRTPVEYRVVLASAAKSLIDASGGCGLVVLGSRGRSGLAGSLTGSVSGHVLRHAHCPVCIVRG